MQKWLTCARNLKEDRIIVANYPRNEMNMYHRNVVRRYLDSSAINVFKIYNDLKRKTIKYLVISTFEIGEMIYCSLR